MRVLFPLLLALLIAACQPDAPADLPPTAIPFPTMTPGSVITGLLPTAAVIVNTSGQPLVNPATAVALASLPTTTPDYRACPAPGAPVLSPLPATGADIETAVQAFLNAGGAPASLADSIRAGWGWTDDSFTFRADADFTGEGTPEVLLAFAAPDEGGTLLILACQAGRYLPLHQLIAGNAAPRLSAVTDLNFDGRADVLASTAECLPGTPATCLYRAQLLTWSPSDGRFIGLLAAPLLAESPPEVADVDDDRVLEIVVRLSNPGNSETGPLRTGVNIYDWNGTSYVLSIIQLDPPRYQIQVVQQADRAFSRQEMDQAISLYNLALENNALRFWFNDEPAVLRSYIFYRLLLAYAYTDDGRLLPTYQAALNAYPDKAAAPVYLAMIDSFWNAWQVTNNLHSACQQVQAIIGPRPEALALLNRYGSRNPAYSAQDLCPF